MEMEYRDDYSRPLKDGIGYHQKKVKVKRYDNARFYVDEGDVKTPFRLGDVMAFAADGQLHEVVDAADPGSGLRRPGVNDSQR